MPYKYLKDGTEYTAKELNDRFDSEQGNVNSTTSDEMQHGALSHFHLPMMIGRAGKTHSEFPVLQTDSVTDFGDVTYHESGSTIASLTFSPTLTLSPSSDDSINAIILMFDCNIEEFQQYHAPQGVGITVEDWNPFDRMARREDVYYATFRFVVDDDPIAKSARSVSPGWTLGGTSDWFYNSSRDEDNRGISLPFDNYSFQTVSMRTVLRPSDIGHDLGLLERISVQVTIGTYVGNTMLGGIATPVDPPANKVRIAISKHNFTCLPIQAKDN